MKTKLRMQLEIKEISEQGSFEGMLSPYGNVDDGNDVVVAGAYAKTLKDQGPVRPMLWQHKADTPIGELTLEDRPEGLWAKGQLLMSLPEAQKAYLLLKAGIVSGLSIGYEAIKDSIHAGVRHLKEIKLYEGSVVTFPMDERARVFSVKKRGESAADFHDELTELQLTATGFQMRSALASALEAPLLAGLSKEQILATTETILQQFADAYLAYVPAYVDALTNAYGDLETWNAKQKEIKASTAWSAADKQFLKHSILALFDVEAGKTETTSPSEAAETKSEPVEDHSALSSILNQAKENFQSWNSKLN